MRKEGAVEVHAICYSCNPYKKEPLFSCITWDMYFGIYCCIYFTRQMRLSLSVLHFYILKILLPFFPAPIPDEKCNVCIQNDRNVSPSKNENMKAALHPSSLSFLLRKERNDRISG